MGQLAICSTHKLHSGHVESFPNQKVKCNYSENGLQSRQPRCRPVLYGFYNPNSNGNLVSLRQRRPDSESVSAKKMRDLPHNRLPHLLLVA